MRVSVPTLATCVEAIRQSGLGIIDVLTFYAAKSKTPVSEAPKPKTVPGGVDWIDAYDPTAEERARLKKAMGVEVPTLDDLLEIETSSRLSVDDGALRMSLPVTVQDRAGYPTGTSIGFVVTPDKVATLRFADLPSFDQLVRRIGEKGDLSEGGFGATISIVEALIDQLADLLERVGGELDSMSRSIFADGVQAMNNRPHHSNRRLAGLLERVGRSGDLASKVSETLLGLSRMAPFMVANAGSNLTSDLKRRIDMISADTKSLHEYEEHLATKTQLLLDTLLGLTNIEQNNVFRVLTVVSVIGIPPTLVASIYGMNFKHMPELEWAHGYPFGLSVIALSAILPALWFKIKGWW